MKQLRFVPIAALMMFGSLLMSQEQPKPLGDVVRQNKPTKKATRVITDEDMPSHPQPAPAPAAANIAQPATDESGAKQATDPSKDDKTPDKTPDSEVSKEKSKDSPEVQAMKSRVKELDGDINHMQRMLQGTEDASVNDPDPERRKIFENVSKNHRYSLDRAQAERAELNKKIEEAQKEQEKKADQQ
jgi:hypothetical protein